MIAPIRTQYILLIALLCAVLLPSPRLAAASELLEFDLDPDKSGVVHVSVRNAGDSLPTITLGTIDEADLEGKVLAGEVLSELKVDERVETARWKPFVIAIDSRNLAPERLEKIKKKVLALAKRELGNGSRFVLLIDSHGQQLLAATRDDAAKKGKVWWTTLNGITANNPPDDKADVPFVSNAAQALEQMLPLKEATLPSKSQATMLIFSSLCVAPKDSFYEVVEPQTDPGGEAGSSEGPPAEPTEKKLSRIRDFPGPIRIFTWSSNQHPDCAAQRDRWLGELRAVRGDDRITDVLDLDSGSEDDFTKAMEARGDVTDETVTLSGIPYSGGPLRLLITLDDGAPYPQNTWDEGTLEGTANAWTVAAAKQRAGKIQVGVVAGFIVLGILLLVGAVFKARSQGKEVARWEAVGEAEDLDTNLDPDAWNATIFQLTGAMPVLTDIAEATQLGPGSETAPPKGESTVDAPAPMGDPDGDDSDYEDGGEDAVTSIDEAANAESTTPTPQPAPDGADESHTGMTVGMPVLDDGTGYDADRPFEIGVLQFGRPVARKTKRFRKVFSIGRATDNRVVIQKDDTVHRYHVVVRPAVEGKEWWLEVSPTASNRTNLNGKDLRSGGRYRLPAKFRLQLGEATEVRGRLGED